MQTKSSKMSLMETGVYVKRAWVTALSDEKIADPTHTTPVENKIEDCATDGNV